MDVWQRMFEQERADLEYLLSQEFGGFEMTKEQAAALALEIQCQCPLHQVLMVEDTRHARWIISVCKPGAERMLIIESRYEWDQALLAWDVLRD